MFLLFCGVGWIMEQGNFLCSGYASTCGYASKIIKAKSTGVCCVLRGGWIIERGNLLCVGYASTRGCASNLNLRVPVFVVFLVFFS